MSQGGHFLPVRLATRPGRRDLRTGIFLCYQPSVELAIWNPVFPAFRTFSKPENLMPAPGPPPMAAK